MPGTEGPGRSLAMNEQLAPLVLDTMCLDLAGVVGDVEKEVEQAVREEVAEDLPGVVAYNLAVGQRAVDARPHGAEIARADLGPNQCAGELAIGKSDAGLFGGPEHLLQEPVPIW